jgi:hypothetical protein
MTIVRATAGDGPAPVTPRSVVRTASLVAGVGYVLFFWSERVFWSFPRSGDDIAILLGGWAVYSLFAYLLLSIVSAFRVSGWASIFIAGAVFGWIDEGVYAMTLYGDPSMPFPATISWTALAWHAPLSVVIGIVGFRQVLTQSSPRPGLMASAALGVVWGIWAAGWGAEQPPVFTPWFEFLAQAVVFTLVLAAAHSAISFGSARSFKPTRTGLALTIGSISVFFAAVTLPIVPWAPAVLVPLIGLSALAMRAARSAPIGETVLMILARPIPRHNLATLTVMPVMATLVYAGLMPSETHLALAVVLTVGGAVAFVAANVTAFRSRR